jgi:hypothetical protein
MYRKYNPEGIFRQGDSKPEDRDKKGVSFILPRRVGIVSLIKNSPVAESELIAKTTSPKTELQDPNAKPLQSEEWESYVARLAKEGKTPPYSALGEIVAGREDLKGGSWDLFRAAYEKRPTPSTSFGPTKSPATDSKEKVK